MKRTAQRILDYLRGFKFREDTYTLEGAEKRTLEAFPTDAADKDTSKMLSNPDAFKDLDIAGVMDAVFQAVPRALEKSRVQDRKYLETLFHYPIHDITEIEQRQAAITELQNDAGLWDAVLAVKASLDVCLYDERFNSSIYGLKALQDAANIVAFVSSIRAMPIPSATRLKRLKDLGGRFDADEKFREAEGFIRELYLPYQLGEAIDDNTVSLNSITGVQSRREFYSGNRLILEVTERLLADEPFRHFVNDEARGVDLLRTMKEKLGSWHKELFSFNLSGIELERWGKNERRRYADLIEYWLSLVNEALYSRIPGLQVGSLAQELAFYLGAARVQRHWADKGFPVTNPKLVDARQRRVAVSGAFNTSLIASAGRDRVVANDIHSDRDRNIFIITGPNNGGKTTYIRQVGQMYWLAHVGMGIPAEHAELSLTDALFTSFTAEDNTAEGTGLYLTELKRISRFTRPGPGHPRMTPYSVILFDEFANGTDHQESLKRTQTILDHLSQKGVTAYFTTHKHEIAELVERGELPGACNLGAEVKHQNGGIITTYRMIRNSREWSYGHLQAEAMGITPEALSGLFAEELSRGLYPAEDTRLTGSATNPKEGSGD